LLHACLSKKIMILTLYQTHLQKYLTPSQFLVMTILLSLIQSEKQVRLERLSRVFPYLITAESRRRKLQRFLDLPHKSDRINLVPINYLLVDHLLSCWYSLIARNRPQSMGMY